MSQEVEWILVGPVGTIGAFAGFDENGEPVLLENWYDHRVMRYETQEDAVQARIDEEALSSFVLRTVRAE